MQIVVEINEEQFDTIKRMARNQHYRGELTVLQAIAYGIVLPEEHGDLIDINELEALAKEHEIGVSAISHELIYEVGKTSRHDPIYKPLLDVMHVLVKAKGGVTDERKTESEKV